MVWPSSASCCVLVHGCTRYHAERDGGTDVVLLVGR